MDDVNPIIYESSVLVVVDLPRNTAAAAAAAAEVVVGLPLFFIRAAAMTVSVVSAVAASADGDDK